MASWTPTRPRLTKPLRALGPERFGLGLADIDREDLPSAGLVHAMRDHQRLVDHAAAVTDPLHLCVEEQVWVAALQRTRPERLDMLIQRGAHPADLALGDPPPQALDPLVDPAGRDPAHIRLLDHRQQRLLTALARLHKTTGNSCLGGSWGSAAPSRRPWCPSAAAGTRCDGSPDPPAALAELNADQLGHCELHHLGRDGLDRLADHISVLIEQHPLDDLLDRHPLGTGHAAPPFVKP